MKSRATWIFSGLWLVYIHALHMYVIIVKNTLFNVSQDLDAWQ